MSRIDDIKKELKSMEHVNDCFFNNDGLYNEMRILKEKLLKELEALEREANELKKEG
ncbi:MAG: hypothetical protein JXR88_13555 [Clostridia bacterium]|nr:hypothetical protein [Clostridia bacterium]